MKRKTCLVILALSSGLMMVFAAGVDKCTEQFNACKESCLNQKSQCKARGSDPGECSSRFNGCNSDCDKALKTCQTKKK